MGIQQSEKATSVGLMQIVIDNEQAGMHCVSMVSVV